MIKRYKDYNLPCWRYNTSQASQDFIRSEFDFSARQRRALRGTDKANMKITVDAVQMLSFKRFWIDINYGASKFVTDMYIFGDPSLEKVVRFIGAYSVQEVSYITWEITCTAEILETTIVKDWLYNCPRIPHVRLVPQVPLVPCGTP